MTFAAGYKAIWQGVKSYVLIRKTGIASFVKYFKCEKETAQGKII
jgi:hypothetical protein